MQTRDLATIVKLLQILNRIAAKLENTEKADDYYNAVLKRYGLYVAAMLLPCCSSEVVLQCLKTYKVEVTSRQLLRLVKRYPEQTEELLAALKQHAKTPLGAKYEIVFEHIAKTDLNLYLKLAEKYNASVRLGWRASDKIIKAGRSAVIASDTLHKKQIFKSLRDNYVDFYANTFPKELSEFPDNWSQLYDAISHVASNARKADLVLRGFQKAYGCSIFEHPECVTLELLEILPGEARDKFVETTDRPKKVSEEQWWTYMTTSKSLPLLEAKLRTASDLNSRTTLIECFAETCRINDDKLALARLCALVVEKYRNDDVSVRFTLLRELRYKFDLEKLGDAHWKAILEVIRIYKANEESIPYHNDLLEKHMHYCMLNGFPVEEPLFELIQLNQTFFYNYLISENPALNKRLLLMLLDLSPGEIHGLLNETPIEGIMKMQECICDDGCRTSFFKAVAQAIIRWNYNHPRDVIDIFACVKDKMGLLRETTYNHCRMSGKFCCCISKGYSC